MIWHNEVGIWSLNKQNNVYELNLILLRNRKEIQFDFKFIPNNI